jgi:hypothetical protein
MPTPRIADPDFIDIFERLGPAAMAKATGLTIRAVYARRDNLERKLGRNIVAPGTTSATFRTRFHTNHPERFHLDIENGTIIVGSDQHYWPGVVTQAHKGFVKFCKELKPDAIILNGDVFDGASVSRHPSIGWENKPSVIQEIEACQERLGEIIDAAPKAKRVWSLGNHDARFETRLANVAPQYAKVHGMHLRDHFPLWEPCWSAWVNDDVVIKHRFKGGIHAAFNNALWSGKSIITGHLHKGVVTPFSDYNGTRYACDLPTMADPYGPQFVDYTEDSARNHRSGFAVVTFHKGKILQPQMALVTDDGVIDFERRIYEV